MKRVGKKLGIMIVIAITIIMTLSSTFSTYEVYAIETTTEAVDKADANKQTEEAEKEADLLEFFGKGIGTAADTLVGIALYIPKAGMMAVASLFRALVYGITAIGGTSGDGVGSVDAIIFNQAEITSIDFFDIHEPNDDNVNKTVNNIRRNVSIWYYVFRNLSIVILLGILLYVGIRMAISTVASDEAKYKKMFKDWAVSLALVFVLQYIMIFTIEVNNVLVDVLNDARPKVQSGDYSDGSNIVEDVITAPVTATRELLGYDEKNPYDNALDQIGAQAWHLNFTVGVSSAIVYVILIGVTILFLIMYIKRMLTIGFLIVISPLITITYSIDKMGDGKSQALNAWLKEFVFNVLIQPFHCVIYLIFTSIAVNMLVTQQTLASAVLSICMILFIFKGEKIVKEIFNFRAGSLGEAIGGAAAIATGMSLLKARGDKNKKKDVNTKNLPKMETPTDKTAGGQSRISNRQTNTNDNSNANTNTNTNSGIQTQNNNRANSNSQTEAMPSLPIQDLQSNKKPNVLKRLKNKVRSGVNGAQKMYGKLPEPVRKYLAASAKLATYGTMAALGASTGNSKAIMSGIYAAKSMNDGATAISNSRKANQVVMANEEKFAQAYKNFKSSSGMTDDQMAAHTQYLLEHGDTNNMSQDEIEYWSYARQMQHTYSAVGEDNISDRMQETLGLIASGQITPPDNVKKELVNVEQEPVRVEQEPVKVKVRRKSSNSENVNTPKEPQKVRLEAHPKNQNKGKNK